MSLIFEVLGDSLLFFSSVFFKNEQARQESRRADILLERPAHIIHDGALRDQQARHSNRSAIAAEAFMSNAG
jgi:hypothetical protein